MANPAVIAAIIASSRRYHADPAAMLATALQESGARYNAVGDQGTSFGPYQYHVGGALGSHTPQWAESNAEIQDEARRFAQYQIHGGQGAAALQRPADPAGYAAAVQAKLPTARELLAEYGGAAPPPTRTTTTRTTTNASVPGGVGVSGLDLERTGLIQSLIDANANLVGIPSISLPQPPVEQLPQAPAPAKIAPRTPTSPTAGYEPTARGIYSHANFAGPDQGVDYRGTGTINALADAVITRVQANSGWPGAGGKGTGSIVTYRILNGAHKGKYVYVAENITPRVKVGQTVRAGQPIAIARGGYPYTESGWADASGRAVGTLGTSSAGRDFIRAWGLPT